MIKKIIEKNLYGVKELKDGLTFYIIEKKFNWLLLCDFSNAILGINRKNELVWYDGIFIDGTWKSGEWRNGTWQDGVWLDGVWYHGKWFNGIWKNGEWKHGFWKYGIWYKGYDKHGNFHGEGDSPDKW